MLKKYSNELLTIVQKSDFDPTLFEAKNSIIEGFSYFVIQTCNSSIRFAARSSAESFNTFYYLTSIFTPKFPLGKLQYAPSPEHLYDKFKEWLNFVVKPHLDDLSTPDLWQTIVYTHSEAKRELGTQDDFEPFSKEEKLQLKHSIDELRLLIETNFELQKKELAATNKLLDHLSDAVDKQNKLDWRGIAISVAFNIAANLALNPEQVRQLFNLFQVAFSKIIYLLP
jgi:hypothetical protein